MRQSWVTKRSFEEAGFYDLSLWERQKKSGDDAIKNMINQGLRGTSVTVFLLGERTAHRRWVRYELEESLERGNGLLSIDISELADQDGYTADQGDDILDLYTIEQDGDDVPLNEIYFTYDWVHDNGYEYFGDWIEEAAQIAGR